MTQEQALGVAVERWGRGSYAKLEKSIGDLGFERYSVGVFDAAAAISHRGSGDSWEEALANAEEWA